MSRGFAIFLGVVVSILTLVVLFDPGTGAVNPAGVLLAVWLFFAGVGGVIAHRKGRNGWQFFGLGVVLTPLVGIAAALIARPDQAKAEGLRLLTGTERKCPFCAELVKREAIICRFCGKDLPEAEAIPGAQRFKSREDYVAWKAGQVKP